MATAKSDDDSDVSPHPLAENRPGVYVQVVAPRRRKKEQPESTDARGRSASPDARAERSASPDARAESGEVEARPSAREQDSEHPEQTARMPVAFAEERAFARSVPAPTHGSDAPMAASGFTALGRKLQEQAPPPMRASERVDDEANRESGERCVDSVRPRPQSQNTNPRLDLAAISIPPPPRLPSFEHSERDIDTDPSPALRSASLLDAPHSLRPESMPAARSSFTLVAFVAVFSAIIVSAGIVALRNMTRERAGKQAVADVVGSPASQPPAPPTAGPQVQQLAPNVARESAAVASAVTTDVVTVKTTPKPRAALAAPTARALHVRAGAQRAPAAAKPVPAAREAQDGVESANGETLPDPDEPLDLPTNPYR